MPKKKRTKKDLIAELSLALEIAAIQNQFGGWGFVSPFQELINRLLVEAGRKPVDRVKNPFKVGVHGCDHKFVKRPPHGYEFCELCNTPRKCGYDYDMDKQGNEAGA